MLIFLAIPVRLLYMVVDPLGFRRVWTYFADNILFTITFPITIVASLLMSLYWYAFQLQQIELKF
jgi:hypothetical protein